MFDNELPEFRKTKHEYAMKFINSVLMGMGGASLVRLESFEDYHFRAIFKRSYFQLAEDADEPSKSQWNTLKKKMKRRNHSVFIFREYGTMACDQKTTSSQETCFYIDFGFLYD
jgi:hypothetical protein